MSDLVTENLPLIATAPDGIKRLRGLILELAVRGKLVPQDPADEPASELLKRIEAEKARLVKEGKIRKAKAVEAVGEDEWPFKGPSGWEWVNLSELVSLIGSGWSPACSDHPAPEATWGVLKTTAVQQMCYLEYENKALPSNLKPRPECEVRSGDILITRAGPKNRVGISCLVESSRDRLMISDKIIRFHLVSGIAYDKFIVLCLNAGPTAGYLEKAKSGMAESQMNISQTKLAGAPVPLPPLPEQHRIVARVDELMALCDRLEAEQTDAAEAHARLVDALLATLTASRDGLDTAANWQRLSEHFDTLFTTEASITALKQTVLQLAVMGRLVPQDPTDEPASELLKRIEAEKAQLVKEGKIRKPKVVEPVAKDEPPFNAPRAWQWTRLCQLATEGPRNGYSPKPAAYKTPYRCLTLSATTSGSFREECYKFVDIPLHIAEQHYLKNGDLLIQRGNSIEYVGIAALYEGDDDEFLFPDLMIRLRLSRQTSRRYIHLVLVSNYGRSYFTSRASGTQGSMPKVNHGVVSATPIPLPPLPEQHRIVARVDELMALCDRLQVGLATAREHRARLADTLVQAALEAA